MNNKQNLSLQKSCLWILLSVCLISGGSFVAWLYYRQIHQTHINNDAYRIVAIVQTSPEKELLPTTYLAELLDLSIDHPSNLYRFNINEAEKKLLASPLIKEVSVKRIRPGTIYLDYIPRVPVAFVLDFNNTATDKEGYLLPVKPFFTPKKLPEIYLGLNSKVQWGDCISDKSGLLALNILEYINCHYCSQNRFIKRIDVSRAFDASYGRREIVVIFEEQMERQQSDKKSILFICDWVLRLSPDKHFHQALANYSALRDRVINEQPIQEGNAIQRLRFIVDLRLPQLAFFKGE